MSCLSQSHKNKSHGISSRPRGDLYLLYVHALISVYQTITDTLIYHIISPLYQHFG